MEIEDLYVFDVDAGRAKIDDEEPGAVLNDASATFEGGLALVFPGSAGLHAILVLEPVDDAVGDRYFQDFGLYAEELYLSAPVGGGELQIGKFNLEFGLANEDAPGLFGDEVAGDYELTERIGVAAGIPVAALPGEPALSIAAFMADTTPLSDSLGTSRGRLRRRDGGVSNSGAPESFALSLAGAFADTGYHLGLRYQAPGAGDEAAEYGGVLGLTRRINLGGAEVLLIGEAAYFPCFDGARESAAFLTLGAAAEVGDFTLSAVYGQSRAGTSTDGRFATAGIDYELTDELSVSLGYRYLEDEGAASNSLGLQLTLEFGVR